MRADEALTEARRALGICNACGYCNGFCDVFEAAKRRPALTDTDLHQLANLCHHCRNCLYACQYAPPHPFAVNVPRALARARWRSYEAYVWPDSLALLFRRNVLAAPLVALAALVAVVGGLLIAVPVEQLFARYQGPGAFYRVVPLEIMILLGALPLGWSLIAMTIGLYRFWQATRPGSASLSVDALAAGLRDTLVLRNLHGGGPGCNDLDERFSHARRWLHHGLFYGFLLCLAATVAASLYHHLLGLEAPYPLLSPPVLLGTVGGLAMAVSTAGLAYVKWRADPEPTAAETLGADYGLLALLFLVAVTGLVLLGWRASAAMGLLLAVHLGSVLGLFLLLPYSKFVHAMYRFAALLGDALDRHREPRSISANQAERERT